MPDNQFGFRHGHSTTHATAKLTSDINNNLNKNICTGAVLIDMEKAFESVWLDGLLFKLHKLKFEQDILLILSDMLFGRKFVVTDGEETSNHMFRVGNGLQQGMINAPVLFNLYIKNLIINPNLNTADLKTIAYADDLVIYYANHKIANIRETLQAAVDFSINYLHTWHIRINENKCESILFRRPVQIAATDTKKHWKKFKIKVNNKELNQQKIVKYLGINLDHFGYLNQHINIQIAKAKKAFVCNSKIFYSSYLNNNVKRICYLSLIRPILTYGCPIWYNCSASYMERLRKFERKCIRVCNGKYRKAETQFKHYISNQTQYGNFDADRIDLHIINLIREHIRRTTSQCSNSLSYGLYYTNEQIIESSIEMRNIPGPEAFNYLDKIGYIQNTEQIPLIYHVQRKPTEKGFEHARFSNPDDHLRFSTSFRRMDQLKFMKKKEKYWWLH